MNQQINYQYEIMVVDFVGKSEITTVKSLSNALAYSEKLWQDSVIKEASSEPIIEDKILGITLQVHKVELQAFAKETAFLLSVNSVNFDEIGKFRHKLLVHLISKLGFVNARVVSDSISEQISRNIYPLIKKVENVVRKNVVKILLQQHGLSWWETVPKSVLDKVNQRKTVANSFNGFVDTSACLTDFNDISELILKAPFANEAFKINWNSLAAIRDKVLTYTPLVIEDYAEVKELSKNILDILEKETDIVNLSSHYIQPSVTKSVIEHASEPIVVENVSQPILEVKKVEPIHEAPVPILSKVENEESVYTASVEKNIPETVVAQIIEQKMTPVAVQEEAKVEKPQERPTIVSGDNLVSESEFLTELKRVESVSNGSFINLKTFVVSVLAPKGYAAGYAYSLSKVLNENGKVVLYDAKEGGLAIRAIRSN